MNVQPDCRFCLPNNLLKDPLLAESARGFAIEARGYEPSSLLIPKEHVETLADLPDDWWVDAKELLGKLAYQNRIT